MSDTRPSFPLPLKSLIDEYDLSSETTTRLAKFAAMLVNDDLAPTTVRDPDQVLNDHLADALVALQLPQIRAARSVADLGAGAGVPGLPLAAALPDSHVSLLDGSSRKCEFMQRAADAMGLTNVTVLHERAETWKDGLNTCDAVTARALAALDVVTEYAAPLLRIGGALVAWRGKREPHVEEAGRKAAEILGLEPLEPVHVRPYPGAENRYLHVFLKIRETPGRFPRRDGVARKRPLGKA